MISKIENVMKKGKAVKGKSLKNAYDTALAKTHKKGAVVTVVQTAKDNKWGITDDDYDKFYQTFRDKIAEIDTRSSMLQDAEDNYYLTCTYLLELAQKAYELFMSSEVEERRQIIKLVLQNVRLDGKKVCYDAV